MNEGQGRTMLFLSMTALAFFISERMIESGMGGTRRGILLRDLRDDEDTRPGNSKDLHMGLRRLPNDPHGGVQ
jgi:hypothetical protein